MKRAIVRSTILAAIGITAVLSGNANAGIIEPVFQNFGSFTDTEFGGMGIPNDQVAYSSFDVEGGSLTLALAATKRFNNPKLGAEEGVYTASTGQNSGTPGDPGSASTWNFSFYAELSEGSTATFASLGLQLLYDLDPGTGTDDSELGVIDFSFVPGDLIEGSQNATFSFLSTGAPFVTPPAFTPFDPLAAGEYSFAWRRASLRQNLVAIEVNVVPAPATLALLGAGLIALAARRRKMSV